MPASATGQGPSCSGVCRPVRRTHNPFRFHCRSPLDGGSRGELPDSVDPRTDSQSPRPPRSRSFAVAGAAASVGSWLVAGRCRNCLLSRSSLTVPFGQLTSSPSSLSPFLVRDSSLGHVLRPEALRPGCNGVIDHGRRSVRLRKTATVRRREQRPKACAPTRPARNAFGVNDNPTLAGRWSGRLDFEPATPCSQSRCATTAPRPDGL